MRVGLYPGTFDPIHRGHIDIIERACSLVDRLVIGIAVNSDKGPLFPLEERVAMVERECKPIGAALGVEIDVWPFENLLIHCAEEVGAQVIIRGLRAVSDFEFEFQMALMNRRLAPELEVVFLLPSARYTFLNATLVKEIARLGGEIAGLLPPAVETKLLERVAEDRARYRKAQA